MLGIIAFALLALLARCHAAVVALRSSPSSSIGQKRHIDCKLQSMGTDQSIFDCPRRTHVDSNGNCMDAIPRAANDNRGCTAYCQIRLIRTYGRERPFTAGSCSDKDDCSVQTGTTITVTNTWAINGGIELGGKLPGPGASELTGAFNFGASYTHSKAIAFTDTIGHTQKAEPGQCGYWTFVPFMITSCGTLTVAETKKPLGVCNKDKFVTVQNYCNTFPYKDSDGKADGEVIFVLKDCKTGRVLDLDQQKSPYRYPGVSTARFESSPEKREESSSPP